MRRSDDALYRSTVLPGVLKADQRSHDEKYVNWNEAAIRELLTIRAEAEIILQFSEMVSAHYTRHMKGHVSLRGLYGLCVNARTYSGKSLAVWMQQIWRSGNKWRNTLPVYFPESLCERGYWLACSAELYRTELAYPWNRPFDISGSSVMLWSYENTFCAQSKQNETTLCYSCERVSNTDTEKKKLSNEVIIFVFFVHKKYSQRCLTLWLNHWCHMDYFNDVLTFLGFERVSCVAFYAGSESSQISSNIS